MELSKDILQKLSAPFPATSISIKVQTKPNEKGNALCVAYIDARDVMRRLDDVVGGEWSDMYQKAPSGGLECALTVCGVTRRDVGDDQNDNETEKAGYSDAFKRAAVKFGIGRFLYDLPKMYGQAKVVGKNVYLADGEEEKLRRKIEAALSGKPQPKPAPEKTAPEQPAANPDPIDDESWNKWSQLAETARKMHLNPPTPNREKMTKGELRDQYKTLFATVKTAEIAAAQPN